MPRLHDGEDYEVDEKQRTVAVTESGVGQGRAAPSTSTTSTRTRTGRWSTTSSRRLRAEALYHKDVEYVVQNGEVLIVDEFTGRILDGRR